MSKTPFRPLDAFARATLSDLLDLDHAALAVIDPDTFCPSITRIGLLILERSVLSLVSDLSEHTTALRANTNCGLLIGRTPGKGDPLTHPRLSLQVRAAFQDKSDFRAEFLDARPKTKLYFDFADFHVIQFEVVGGVLNGGFGKAYRLGPDDLWN